MCNSYLISTVELAQVSVTNVSVLKLVLIYYFALSASMLHVPLFHAFHSLQIVRNKYSYFIY
jgi:hypothetical protein